MVPYKGMQLEYVAYEWREEAKKKKEEQIEEQEIMGEGKNEDWEEEINLEYKMTLGPQLKMEIKGDNVFIAKQS